MNERQIQEISQQVFKETPAQIERKKTGICNEVYELTLRSNSFILRMNQHKDILYGTHRHLPVFKRLRIKTPEIVAEDYSKAHFPFCYHILTKIEGKDLGLVIDTLSEAELISVASEVSDIFTKFNSIAAQTEIEKVLGTTEKDRETIWAQVDGHRKSVLERNSKTGVLDDETLEVYNQLLKEFSPYFLEVQLRWFYDDICYKNVMIHEGKFAGLVDLDFLGKGDYLSAIGTIMSSYHGEDYGKVYLNEIVKRQGLSELQQKIVHVYAILNLVLWTSEEGIKFNSNSSGIINWEKVRKNRDRIFSIYQEMNA